MRKYLTKRWAILLSVVMVVSLFANMNWTVKAAENSIGQNSYSNFEFWINADTSYDSILVPKGCHLTIEGASVTAVNVTIQEGGCIHIVNAGDDGNKIGKLLISEKLIANAGAEIECESNQNIPTVNAEQIGLYDGEQSVNSDSQWAWQKFCYVSESGSGGKWYVKNEPEAGTQFNDNEYRVMYDTNGGAKVTVDNVVINDCDTMEFTTNATLNFILTPPDFRQNQTPIVKIVVHDGDEATDNTETVWSSDFDEGNPKKLTLTDNKFSFKPESEKGFEVFIDWSEYDAFDGNEDFPVIVEVDCQGTIGFNGVANDDTIKLGNFTKVRVKDELTLTWEADAVPSQIKVEVNEKSANEEERWQILDADDFSNNSCRIELTSQDENGSAKQFYYVRVEYSGNEGETGGEGGDNQDPADEKTKSKCVADVQNHEYAYYVASSLSEDHQKEKISTYLETELYYEFFSKSNPDRPYGWIFEDRAAMSKAVTIGDISTAIDATVGLRYYTYTVDLGDENIASGKVYVLDGKDRFIVKTGSTYHVVTASNTGDVYVKGDGEIKIFGNGTCMAGQLDSASQNVIGGHITQEHSGLGRDDENSDLKGLSCRLVVCRRGFQGTKITGDRDAAAWNFLNLGMYDVSFSQNAPAVADVYYGSSALTISSKVTYTDTQTSDKVISEVAVDTTKLAASAVTINKKDENNFELKIHTAYDEIPLILTYTDNTKGYVNLHRVGLAIDKTDIKDTKYDAWHGTDHTVRYTENNTANGKAIYATFYYAGNEKPSESITLFSTVTKKDGSIKKQLITTPITKNGQYVEWDGSVVSNDSENLGIANQGTDRYYDDFLIWSGTEAEFQTLDKVEVIVFTQGDENSFGGVKIGSGNGVVWKNK